jgi:multiple sugar transport system ATP-binding protein
LAELILENLYKSFASLNRLSPTPANLTIGPPTSINQDYPQLQAKSSQVNVLRGINLTVTEGEFMVLVGPSGCGKSTLLRLIAGLEPVTAGKIWLGPRQINDLPPKARDMAMVFQNYALYPHLNVYDNIAFGLRRMNQTPGQKPLAAWGERLLVGMSRQFPQGLRYVSPGEKLVEQRVREVAQLLQIETLLFRFPKQLSGGQKQRVALGRAIARNPQVFLMDEPLSNLDAKLRAETRTQIVQLQRQLGITTIYVTHDQTEAMTMGDRIAVMNQGQIQQIGRPLKIYNQPANKFVAEFIGSPPMNFIPVVVNTPLLIIHPLFRVTLPDKWEKALENYHQQSVLLGVRPEHFQISPAATKNIPVKVDLVEALGNDTYLSVHLDGDINTNLQVRISPDYPVKTGDYLWLSLDLTKVHFFDIYTGNNLLQLPRND